MALDPRVIEVDIAYKDEKLTFSDLAINVTGSYYVNELSNPCTITLFNLTKDQRDYILEKTSPVKSATTEIVSVSVRAGRKSTGTATLFTGVVSWSSITQPPDIGLILSSASTSSVLSDIRQYGTASTQRLSVITAQLAKVMGKNLSFHATERNIANFFYFSPRDAIKKLNSLGVSVSEFNDQLTVMDYKSFLPEIYELDDSTGMVGIPELTENGVIVKTLFQKDIKPGQKIKITSTINPAANGTFGIYQMDFNLSTRDQPFYYTLYGLAPGIVGA